MRAHGKQGRLRIGRHEPDPHTLHVELDGAAWARVQEAAGLAGLSPRAWAAGALARQAGAVIARRRAQ